MSLPIDIAGVLGGVIARRSLLSHPFYQAWLAGRLDLSDLGIYAGQYWRQVEAFPGCLEALSERAPDAARTTLQENLSDEVDGGHLELWRRFAASLGVSPLDDVAAFAETRRCTDFFAQAADNSPMAFALSAIYGYESQIPSVAAIKGDSLRSNYGLDDEAVAYFDVHATVDVVHSARLIDAIEGVVGNDEGLLYTAARGAEAGAAAIWGLLDGVWASVSGTRDRSRFVGSLLKTDHNSPLETFA